MLRFADSTDLLDQPADLRARFEEDGYVLLRHVLDPEPLVSARRAITSVCHDHDWLQDSTDPLDAVPRVEPRVEGEPLYFEVYDDIQRLEAFHAVPHEPSVRRVMTALLGDAAFPHPLSIARLSFPDNDEWATPPHQDYPNNQGTPDLYACWIPLSDCPVELGSLSVLRGSNRVGVAPLEFSLGAGNRRATLDERFDALDWVGGDFELGDVIVFHSLTVHRALPNRSDRLRISVDYRFQREGEPLVEGCLEPHFNRLSWEEIYRGWERAELEYYWRDREYSIVPWDESFHAVPDEDFDDHLRMWFQWRKKHPRVGLNNPDAWWPKAAVSDEPKG